MQRAAGVERSAVYALQGGGQLHLFKAVAAGEGVLVYRGDALGQSDAAQGIDVGAGIHVVGGVELFGRGEAFGLSRQVGPGVGVAAAQVDEAHVVVHVGEHDVRRLQVEVQGLWLCISWSARQS